MERNERQVELHNIVVTEKATPENKSYLFVKTGYDRCIAINTKLLKIACVDLTLFSHSENSSCTFKSLAIGHHTFFFVLVFFFMYPSIRSC